MRRPEWLDDVHVLTDKLGVIQRERSVGGETARVGALLFTTFRPTAPKLLLNVESDDYGVLEQRTCGCLLGRLGLGLHLHGIRSYDKLTSGGMTFVASDVTELLDEVLPAQFGGASTDYQLVEEEDDGLPRVSIVISPRVGPVDEPAVIATVVNALAAGPAYKQAMASVWQAGETLEVVRREPHATATAKISPAAHSRARKTRLGAAGPARGAALLEAVVCEEALDLGSGRRCLERCFHCRQVVVLGRSRRLV